MAILYHVSEAASIADAVFEGFSFVGRADFKGVNLAVCADFTGLKYNEPS